MQNVVNINENRNKKHTKFNKNECVEEKYVYFLVESSFFYH